MWNEPKAAWWRYFILGKASRKGEYFELNDKKIVVLEF